MKNARYNSRSYRAKVFLVELNQRLSLRHALLAPLTLSVETTNRCNGRCFYCFRHVKQPAQLQDLAFSTFASILEKVPSNTVILEGCAEPLMNAELPAMVSHASSTGRFTYLTTNGSLLESDLAAQLIEAGLGVLRFSVNSLDSQRSLRLKTGIAFDVVKANIEEFGRLCAQSNGQPPVLQSVTVVMKDNFSELPAIAETAIILGARKVYFNDLVPYNPQMAKRRISADQFAELKDLTAAIEARGIETELCFFRRFEPLPVCTLPWQWLNVKLDGTVYPCFQGTVPALAVGNVFQESFANIWNGDKLKALRGRILHGASRECEVCNKHGWTLPPPSAAPKETSQQ